MAGVCGTAKCLPEDGGTVSYFTVVSFGVLVPGPTWSLTPVTLSVVTGSQLAAAAVAPIVLMSLAATCLVITTVTAAIRPTTTTPAAPAISRVRRRSTACWALRTSSNRALRSAVADFLLTTTPCL